MKPNPRATARFRKEHATITEKLRKYPNVVAFGHGVKFEGKRSTGTKCLTVYVREKPPKRRLLRSERIESEIPLGRGSLLTDVIEIGDLRQQDAPTGYPFGECLNDRTRSGTRSAYAETERGTMALTCAHVIAGLDLNPFTSAPIRSFDWQAMAWSEFGVSDHAVYDGGSGSPHDFGYVDAALVRIRPEILENLDIPLEAREVFVPQSQQDVMNLRGKMVRGFGIASGDCSGIIQAVLVARVDDSSFKADLVIVSPTGDGLTQDGDSGMLWQLEEDGTWIGQHALGRVEPAGHASKVTVAAFLYRIQSKLQIRSLH